MSSPSDAMTGTHPAQESMREQPMRFRGGGFAPRSKPWTSWVAFAVILVVWQTASSAGLVSQLALPSPVSIAEALWELIVSGDLWRHLQASVWRILYGWGLGTAAGLTVGFSMGISSVARSVGIPVVSALFPIPKIALLPLFILWFGIGEPSKVATIALGVFFPTVINTYSGVDNVPKNLIRMGQSFNVPPRDIIIKIILPGALPGILAGFRISSSIALILLVAAEMIGAEFGIGALVLQAGNLMQTDRLMAGVVMLSVLGVLIGVLLTRLERWWLRWR